MLILENKSMKNNLMTEIDICNIEIGIFLPLYFYSHMFDINGTI